MFSLPLYCTIASLRHYKVWQWAKLAAATSLHLIRNVLHLCSRVQQTYNRHVCTVQLKTKHPHDTCFFAEIGRRDSPHPTSHQRSTAWWEEEEEERRAVGGRDNFNLDAGERTSIGCGPLPLPISASLSRIIATRHSLSPPPAAPGQVGPSRPRKIYSAGLPPP